MPMPPWPKPRPVSAPGWTFTTSSASTRASRQIYQEGLWICGRSALPTGCASPASRASSQSGEMLAFAHIPTGATANKGIDMEDLRSRIVAPAVAQTAIGAGIEIGGATP